MLHFLCTYAYKRRIWGQRGLQPPKLGRNPFHSGKFSERTIGNSGRKLTERLQPPPLKFDVLLRPCFCFIWSISFKSGVSLLIHSFDGYWVCSHSSSQIYCLLRTLRFQDPIHKSNSSNNNTAVRTSRIVVFLENLLFFQYHKLESLGS